MSVRYLDAHCHVQFEQYDKDREAILAQMREQGVEAIVVGCDLESSKKAMALAEENDFLYASIGLHPNHTSEEHFDGAQYRELAGHRKVVAIGECGLDFFRPSEVTSEVKEKQKELFGTHVALAGELDKPLIIHARPSKGTMDAYHDVITILQDAKREYPHLRGDIHFFVGGVSEAEALITLGFTVSFTAVITFARDYDAVIRTLPLASILAETDSPYVAPASRRGERNDPCAVIDVVARIAEIRGDELETVREGLLANTRQMFDIA